MPAGAPVRPRAAPGSPPWVEELRRTLARAGSVPLPEGPIQLRIHLRLPASRNWVALWRPAVDALGPILGYDHTRDPYHPRDDRLTRLEFHRQADDRIGNRAEVEYVWTPLPREPA